MKYDVFISYRREGGFETANLISEKLKSRGFRVFFDVESMRGGKFNVQLYDVIEECKDVIVVLPESGLDRCSDPEDWVRLELLHALEHKKNIVPIMLNGFTWPSPMPEGLEDVRFMQAVTSTNWEYFDLSITRLTRYLKSKAHTLRRKIVRYGLLAIVGVGLLYGGAKMWVRSEAIPLCTEVTNNASAQVVDTDAIMSEVESFHNEWDTFVGRTDKARNTREVNELNKSMLELIAHYNSTIQPIGERVCATNLNYTDGYARRSLQSYGLSSIELQLLDDQAIDIYNQSSDLFKLAKELIENDIVCKPSSTELMQSSKDIIRHSYNSYYYFYTNIIRKMPEKAREEYWQLNRIVKNAPSDATINLSEKDIELKYNRELDAISQAVTNIKAANSVQDDALSEKLDEYEAMLQRIDGDYNNFLATVRSNNNLTADNLYNDVVLTMAMFLEIAVEIESTTDPELNLKYEWTTTPKRVATDIEALLNNLVAIDSNYLSLVTILKEYYSMVANGQTKPSMGAVVMTVGAEVTPTPIQMGDILLMCNDTPLLTQLDYEKGCKHNPKRTTIELLRWNGKKLNRKTVSYDPTMVSSVTLLSTFMPQQEMKSNQANTPK